VLGQSKKKKGGRAGRAPVVSPETQDAFPAKLDFLWFFLSAMRKKEHFLINNF